MSPVSISPPEVVIDHVLTILAAVAGRQEMRTGAAELVVMLSGAIIQNISWVFVVANISNIGTHFIIQFI